MVDLTSEKAFIQVEDTTTGAAASEATMQKIGSSINFWNSFFEGSRAWFLNGKYSITGAPQFGVDGAHFCWSDCEIYAVAMFNQVAGSAGDTELDIVVYPAAGGPSFSIFSTRPKIPSSSGNDARVVEQILPSVSTLFSSVGVTIPVVSTTQLNAGDMLKCNFIGKQTDGESAGIILALRPR